MPVFKVRPADPMSEVAGAIVARHLQMMYSQSPEGSVHALSGADLAGPDVDFFLLWDGDRPLAMGALKRFGDREGELKSMHVVAEARGRGAGAAMLDHLLAHARATGLRRVSLETGSDGNFVSARGLYIRAGFTFCKPFADYVPDPESVFMTLDLEG
ncbi:GNAT family N-acetyltransferase [Chachezhania sediminis]|uniref:GNAT family N-acetyltransferase n=1 Tax=Chachezhania sediminis TaxID=2599291 RepID=UPI00131B315E|nr:GNAT family N-acetyltransferase [Chachezhania sediminis]